MTAPQELRTTRLLLRSFERNDVPAIVRFAGAREIAATTTNIPHPYTEQDARGFLTQANEGLRDGRSVIFAVTIPPETEICGGIGLEIASAHRRAELGYWIGLPHWGKGFATEAATAVVSFGFETLQLHRIYANHYLKGISHPSASWKRLACGTKDVRGNTFRSGTALSIWKITDCLHRNFVAENKIVWARVLILLL